MDRQVNPELVERFCADLARAGFENGKLGLAVSGGPDSLALLLFAHSAMPNSIEVAVVDHGLRTESAEEARQVAGICRELGVRCEILTVEVASGNVQAEARSARYFALMNWLAKRGLDALATGHHADDQAETLLMRLNRGSGVAGLAGIRERTRLPDCERDVVRPLLRWRRAELSEIVATSGFAAVDDPSNRNIAFDRVRMREALTKSDWLNIEAAARSAANLADAEEALKFYVSAEMQQCVAWPDGSGLYRPTGPRLIRQRVVARIIAEFGGKPRGAQVAALVEQLENGAGGNLAGVLARVDGDDWVFGKEPERSN